MGPTVPALYTRENWPHNFVPGKPISTQMCLGRREGSRLWAKRDRANSGKRRRKKQRLGRCNQHTPWEVRVGLFPRGHAQGAAVLDCGGVHVHQRLDCACEARDPFVWADVPGFPVSRFGAFQHHLLWPLMVCFPR